MSSIRPVRRLLLAGVLSIMTLFSQSYTASIRGVVTDASSAALPGAKVTVTDIDRGVRFETAADAAKAMARSRARPSKMQAISNPRPQQGGS